MRNSFCITLLCSGLAGCHNVPVFNSWIFEHPPAGKEYPPIYVTGWQDGCQTGAAAGANALYRFRYEFTQDWELAENPTYYAGWQDAYEFCRKTVHSHNSTILGHTGS